MSERPPYSEWTSDGSRSTPRQFAPTTALGTAAEGIGGLHVHKTAAEPRRRRLPSSTAS